MRPRRGPDTRPQEPKTRVNEAIRVPRVRLIDAWRTYRGDQQDSQRIVIVSNTFVDPQGREA